MEWLLKILRLLFGEVQLPPDEPEPPAKPEPPVEDDRPIKPLPVPNPDEFLAWQLKLLDLHNAERPASQPLRLSTALCKAADRHAQEMAERRKLTHDRRNGESIGDSVNRYEPGWRAVAENIAMGSRSTEGTFSRWMDSPGHRQNIQNTRYRRMGCARYADAAGTPYWCTIFAD